MTEADRLSQSLCVCNRLIATDAWQQADDILLYAALPDEVDLSSLFTVGKRIWLPVVDGDSLRIRQYILGKTAVSTGHYRIEEPTADAPELSESQYSRLSLAVIPGRAFTLTGDRMGRGKGYYDRLLPLLQCTKIGVCFDCQLVGSLPIDPWDSPLDSVIAGKVFQKESLETAYCFIHQKQRVYQYSTMDWQKDDIEYAIDSYVSDIDHELYEYIACGKKDFLRDHKRFGDDMIQAVTILEKLLFG